MSRDPRVDPKRGDVTRAPDGYEYRIVAASRGDVKWRALDDGYEEVVSLEAWRDWSKCDEVLKVAK